MQLVRRNISWSEEIDDLAAKIAGSNGFRRGVSELVERLFLAEYQSESRCCRADRPENSDPPLSRKAQGGGGVKLHNGQPMHLQSEVDEGIGMDPGAMASVSRACDRFFEDRERRGLMPRREGYFYEKQRKRSTAAQKRKASNMSNMIDPTTEKPEHRCDVCGVTFSRAPGLALHKKAKHGIRPSGQGSGGVESSAMQRVQGRVLSFAARVEKLTAAVVAARAELDKATAAFEDAKRALGEALA